jgi:serpin B
MPEVAPADLKQLADGNNAFALDLLNQLREQEGNLFYSPFSISIALAMTYAGAKGMTAEQMAHALHFLLPPEKGAEGGDVFQLNVANSLWGQQGYSFLPDFLDTLASNYGAGMQLVDFTANPEQARQEINSWVEGATQEKIKDLIPQGAIDSLTRLVLANAIYFKANWLNTFDEQATEPAPFQLADGTTVDVPMMHQSGTFGYTRGSDYQAISLPYAGQRASMLLVLPEDIQSFTASLNSSQLDSIQSDLKFTSVILGLPKFDIAYDLSVTQSKFIYLRYIA